MNEIINGIEVDPARHELINAYKDRQLIILGSGFNVWQEFDAARQAAPSADIMCVNFTFIGLEWLLRTNQLKVEHWTSLHYQHFYLRDIYFKDHGIKTHGKEKLGNVDHVWAINRDGGGGLFAVKIALLLGYKKIIVAGMPMDNTRRFYDHPEATCQFTDGAVVLGWKCFKGQIGHENSQKIKAMSGFPKTLFGGFTPEWLNT